MKTTITVFTDDSIFGKTALAHAQKLAQIFDAEIHKIFLTEKPNFKTVFSAADEGNTLCFVMPVGNSKKSTFFNVQNARKWIRRSRVPVLVVGDKEPDANGYQQIVLPLDTNCRDKELALWASYFPAYFQKNCPEVHRENMSIHIIYNQYNNLVLQQKVENNIAFVTKMFDNLEAPYQLHPFTKIDNMHTFGLQFAAQIENSAMLFLMTEHFSLIDLFFGPVENHILGNREKIPVLCLNAREDQLVLCR
jgi:hypothetical protein